MVKGSTGENIDLQTRDIALLVDLFESRLMTLAHIAAIHFDSRREAAKKRIQKLKAAAYIAERSRRPYEPSILHLTQKGFQLLRSNGHLGAYPPTAVASFTKRAHVSELTVRHELDVMSVKAAVIAGVREAPRFEVAEFCTWPRLYEFRARAPAMDGMYSTERIIRPDGFVRIHEHEDDGGLSEHTFFLELDRSTETQERLAAKAACYVNYYRSGGLAARHGRPRSEYADFPFRVLMVFRTAERRNNSAETLLSLTPPILTQVWLTTLGELENEPLGAIWVRPIDVRELMRSGTDSLVRGLSTDGIYRRSTHRDLLMEGSLTKYALLRTKS